MESIRMALVELDSSQKVAQYVVSLKEDKLLVIGLLWTWWDARNKANVGEQMRPTEEVIYGARFMASDIILTREDYESPICDMSTAIREFEKRHGGSIERVSKYRIRVRLG
jgi:hypothetical protein